MTAHHIANQAPRHVRRLALIALPAALAFVAACAEPEPRANVLNRQGNEAYEQGDYTTALDRYREAQVEQPDNTAFTYNAGNALHRLGDFERAVPESQKAAANGTDEVRFRAYYALGNHYVRLERLREARDAYKSALKIITTDEDAKFNLEVVQRLLEEQQQQQQDGQGDQNQQGQQGQQQGQGQQNQQNQQGQQDQQGQPGQQGQSQGQSQGQQQQSGQSQQGQQQGQGQPSGQSNSQQNPAATAQQLEQELQDHIAGFERTQSVEEALRVLEILAEQQRLRQRAVPPPPTGNVRDQ